MWVIFNKSTGKEIDRVESASERNAIVKDCESNDWRCDGVSYRWEA